MLGTSPIPVAIRNTANGSLNATIRHASPTIVVQQRVPETAGGAGRKGRRRQHGEGAEAGSPEDGEAQQHQHRLGERAQRPRHRLERPQADGQRREHEQHRQHRGDADLHDQQHDRHHERGDPDQQAEPTAARDSPCERRFDQGAEVVADIRVVDQPGGEFVDGVAGEAEGDREAEHEADAADDAGEPDRGLLCSAAGVAGRPVLQADEDEAECEQAPAGAHHVVVVGVEAGEALRVAEVGDGEQEVDEDAGDLLDRAAEEELQDRLDAFDGPVGGVEARKPGQVDGLRGRWPHAEREQHAKRDRGRTPQPSGDWRGHAKIPFASRITPTPATVRTSQLLPSRWPAISMPPLAMMPSTPPAAPTQIM